MIHPYPGSPLRGSETLDLDASKISVVIIDRQTRLSRLRSEGLRAIDVNPCGHILIKLRTVTGQPVYFHVPGVNGQTLKQGLVQRPHRLHHEAFKEYLMKYPEINVIYEREHWITDPKKQSRVKTMLSVLMNQS